MTLTVSYRSSFGTLSRKGRVIEGTSQNHLDSQCMAEHKKGYCMQTVVGIFTSQAAAERAAERLGSVGIAQEQINFLIPGASPAQLERVNTTETEQPGMGAALGGVVGGAIGASGLMSTAVVTTLIPGVGPIAAVGLLSLGLVGLLGGALVGATAGSALEGALADGLPKDELCVYEDALRQGRTVLIVAAEDARQAEAARVELAQAGAESLDAARENWWVGLRDAEAQTYTAQGGDFTTDEAVYRRGFEAALRADMAGKSYEEVVGYLRGYYPDVYNSKPFQNGYARGQAYYEERLAQRQA